MNNFTKTTCTVWAAALALAVALTSPTTTRAADINWGLGAQNITINDSDVSTQGTLVGAVNLGYNGDGSILMPNLQPDTTAVTNANVNGVTFVALGITNNQMTPAVSGNFSLSTASPFGLGTFSNGAAGFGSANAPYTSLSTGYQSLLGSAIFDSNPDTITLTMSSLTVGQEYLFEWWVNFSALGDLDHSSATTGGSTVTLQDNVGGGDGDLGQYAIGTFVADSSTEVITFSGPPGSGPQINAFELRAVPDSMNTLLGLGLAISGLIGFYAFDRQRLQKV